MLVTTSRHPSLELKKLALNFSIQKKAKYINRGKKTIEDLIMLARKEGNTKITLVRSKDKIDYIQIHHGKNWEWI